MNYNILNKLFTFVITVSSKYNIDESHGLSHSMNVLHFTRDIYEKEVYIHPGLKEHKNIIYISAVLHDMCDKKYMQQSDGIEEIEKFLHQQISEEEKAIIIKIISTMSYSTVKVNGFPDLGIYQKAYHCVREADLLAAYDFDRCVIYDMYTNKQTFQSSFERAEELFKKRVFKHDDDKLLTTEYAKLSHPSLCLNALSRMNNWRKIMV
jgi:HD superfamily phosphodiesterase